MSTQQANTRTFTASTAVSAWTRAGVSTDGGVYAAPANNTDIGIIQHDAGSGDPVSVRLYHPTFSMMASGAITVGSQVYPAASGGISGSQTGGDIGVALETATAARDIIEIAGFLQ